MLVEIVLLFLSINCSKEFTSITDGSFRIVLGLEIADAGLITHPKVLRLLVDAAEENKIPYQLETGLPGSTDAARISLTKEGVPSGVISVPT
ncbi:MAG: hypothetical protein K6T54_14595, partial [Ignavibacterium sp.]|nr:hypothetical protein [Ignavibacterium sp.]